MSDTKPSPAPALPAATILLLRDGANGIEVFMQTRFEGRDRFSGALLFPGGKVDAQDHDDLRAWSHGAESLSDEHFVLWVAAIREAFEECGVLLVRERGNGAIISAQRLQTLADWRDRLNAGSAKLIDMLRQENLLLACDQLVRFGNWVTPVIRAKRFDTHFFLARAPHDHVLLHDGRESTDSLWITIADALQGQKDKRYNIVFPTQSNLEKLQLAGADVDAVLNRAAAESVYRVEPRIEKREDGYYVLIPEAAGYPTCINKAEA